MSDLIKPLEVAAQGAGYRNYRDATENVSGQTPVLNSILAHAGTIADLADLTAENERLRSRNSVLTKRLKSVYDLYYDRLPESARKAISAALKGGPPMDSRWIGG